MSRALVKLWGKEVGAVQWLADKGYATFQYHDAFVDFANTHAIEPSPYCMPVVKGTIYSFANLNPNTFWGLPGLLADALPDKFGNDIINRYLATKGFDEQSFNPVDRLCYLGGRAMGALTFEPVKDLGASNGHLDIDALIDFGQSIVAGDKGKIISYLNSNVAEHQQLIEVTTSAGGAKSKALVDYDPMQERYVLGGENTTACMIKFDSGSEQKRHEYLPLTQVEYAYYLQALHAGIKMQKSWLLEKDNAFHFVTERFDRRGDERYFMQSLCGIFHWDYLQKSHSYENAMLYCRKYLNMGVDEITELFRIAVFNVIYRNEDDHTKNISVMMAQDGKFSLAPAYDLTYAHVPSGGFIQGGHCMSVNSKVADISLDDLIACAAVVGIKRPKATRIIEQVLVSTEYWSQSADAAGLTKAQSQLLAREIGRF